MLTDLFPVNGTFEGRDTFRYNKITQSNFVARCAVLTRIEQATDAEFDALEYQGRMRLLAFLKQEAHRYFGDAVRKYPGHNGEPVGSPLPQLQFESTATAARYQRALHAAGIRFRRYLALHQPILPLHEAAG